MSPRRPLLRWSLLRWLLLVVVVLAVAALVYRNNVIRDVDRMVQDLDTWQPPSTCSVYDRHGESIDSFYVERRIWVDIEELPPHVGQAIVAAEDRRFYEHPGVDLLGIARALQRNISAGRVVEGGSTLTQQLVKNLVVGKQRSYTRKAREAIAAVRLESSLSKQEILELYLNYVYLGSGNYGVEAAAQDYFGRSARELNVSQAALLAGLIPAPSQYSPRRSPEAAKERRRVVLLSMLEAGYIDQSAAHDAMKHRLVPTDRALGRSQVGASYLTAVRREIRERLGSDLPYQVGLQVHTAYDSAIQAVAEQVLLDQTAKIEKRQGHLGAKRRLGWSGIQDFLERDVAPRGPDQTCFEAMFIVRGKQLRTSGPDRWTLQNNQWWRRVRGDDPTEASQVLWEEVRAGDVYDVCEVGPGEVTLKEPGSWVDGAIVVIDNHSGEVAAMVGGVASQLEGFNKATQGRRQPGSSFKPFVYAAALETGLTQVDEVLDGPLVLPGARGRAWRPRNSGGGFAGLLPMRRALALSLNTVAVRMALAAGPDALVDMAHRLGVRSELRHDLTLALGSSEVSVLDQATGFSTLARMGRYVEPALIRRLETQQGTLLANAGEPIRFEGATIAVLPGGEGEQVVAPAVAYQVVDMMREVVRAGTATRAWDARYDRAGKTGTTTGTKDAWFVGTTPRWTVAVWVGTEKAKGLGRWESGGSSALPMWLDVVKALPQEPGERFPVPDEVMLVPFQGQWVGLPRDGVPADILDVEDIGDAPLPIFPTSGSEWMGKPEWER